MFNNRTEFFLKSPIGTLKLNRDPMGWDDTETEIGRSEKTYGIFLTISNNLQFTVEAKEYLETAYKVYGVQAEVSLSKRIKHPQTDEWELAFQGELSFSTLEIENNKLKIDFIEDGLRELFVSQIKEKFELNRIESIKGIPITPLETDELTIQGRDIYLLSKLSTKDNFTVLSGKWSPNTYEVRNSFHPFPLSIDANSDPLNITIPFPTYNALDQWKEPSIANMFFSLSEKDRGRVKIKANVNFKVSALRDSNARNLSFNVELRRYDANLVLIGTEVIKTYQSGSVIGQSFSFPFEKELYGDTEVKQGESFAFGIYTTGEYTGNLTSEGFMELDFTDVNVSLSWAEDSFYRRTNSKFLPAYEVGQRLTEIFTGSRKFVSDLLNSTEWKDLGFTCGGWLRNLKIDTEAGEIKEWPLTISFEDFYKSVHAVLPVGYGIITKGAKQFITLEKITYFFQPYVTIKLDQVSGVKRKVAEEFIFSSITTGYSKGGDYEKPLGLDEYNIQATNISPITKVDNKYEALGSSRADSYAVEDARRMQREDFADEDTPYDKDNFLIDAKFLTRSNALNYYQVRLWQDDFETLPTGVYSPETAFNLRLSPANNKHRHSQWFSSAMVMHPEDKIRYSSTEGNSQLGTKLPGKTAIKENADTVIRELSNPIFQPEWIEFTYPLSQDLVNQLQGTTEINGNQINNYYGLTEFINENGTKERGYLFTAKIKDKITFKLLKSYGI